MSTGAASSSLPRQGWPPTHATYEPDGAGEWFTARLGGLHATFGTRLAPKLTAHLIRPRIPGAPLGHPTPLTEHGEFSRRGIRARGPGEERRPPRGAGDGAGARPDHNRPAHLDLLDS